MGRTLENPVPVVNILIRRVRRHASGSGACAGVIAGSTVNADLAEPLILNEGCLNLLHKHRAINPLLIQLFALNKRRLNLSHKHRAIDPLLIQLFAPNKRRLNFLPDHRAIYALI